MTVLTMEEASRACGILFGPEVKPSLDFFKYLQPSGLKAAYRKKALETHPDRAGSVGEDADKMAALFMEATSAYHHLLPVILSNGAMLSGGRVVSNQKPKSGYASRSAHQKERSDHFYKGGVPRRNLLIGQFLYYSGIISWKTLIDAIVWQRRQRPLIGQIALKWNKLSERDIQRILMRRRLGEKFGECAARTGFLTRFEVLTLLGLQSRRQCLIGEYFLRQNLLRVHDMEKMVQKQQVHNRRISYR